MIQKKSKSRQRLTGDIPCKHCGSLDIRLAGIVNNGNQRFKCKTCTRTFTRTERKYSTNFKMEVIKQYLDKNGIRSIERKMNVNSRMIVYWIQQFGKVLKEKLNNIEIPKNLEDVEVVEIDREQNKAMSELFADKNPKISKIINKHIEGRSLEIRGDSTNYTYDEETGFKHEYALLLTENRIRLLIFK